MNSIKMAPLGNYTRRQWRNFYFIRGCPLSKSFGRLHAQLAICSSPLSAGFLAFISIRVSVISR
jgi:hypothetical protein